MSPVLPSLPSRLAVRPRIAAGLTTLVVLGAGAAPAAANLQTGPDYHSNCTAGFASGSAIVDGNPGAVGTVARPPKQYGSMSDVGYYSRTNCA
jgi:hypothetical protein